MEAFQYQCKSGSNWLLLYSICLRVKQDKTKRNSMTSNVAPRYLCALQLQRVCGVYVGVQEHGGRTDEKRWMSRPEWSICALFCIYALRRFKIKIQSSIKEIFVFVDPASKIPLAAEAAAQGWLRSLTFNSCGGCAVAICANIKEATISFD